MILLWLVAGAALVAALVALRQARRIAKRLEQISQQYWELKYQNGELRLQIQRLGGDTSPASAAPSTTPTAKDSFVPLTSLKR
jgi:hypothetical protein